MAPYRVAVAVPTWRGLAHLRDCLAALDVQTAPGVEAEVLVFNNGADVRVAKWLARQHPTVRVLSSPTNIGFAAACNRMAEATTAESIAFVNDDAVPRRDWLAAITDALRAAPDDVAAVGGVLHDRSGERLDFGGGVVTFDGHALQPHHGKRLSDWSPPEAGSDMPFACGANMLVRRQQFLTCGGFDPEFFAYFEDVDLGWRLWQQGSRITAAPDAIALHRMAATSSRLGVHRRGQLFEWNAYRVAYKNYEEGIWPHVAPLVLMTLISRATHALRSQPGGKRLRRVSGADAGPGTVEVPVTLPRPERRWQRRSTSATAWRALQRISEIVTSQVARCYPWPALWITDEQAIVRLQVLDRVAADDARLRALRDQVQSRRVRPDKEIFERFPRYVVPTYPGDEQLLREVLPQLPADLAARAATFEQLGIVT